MKTFWKALGIAALAAVVPVRYRKDEETGVKSFQSLLWKLDVSPKDGDNMEIGLDLMEGVLTAPLMDLISSAREAELFTDDPEEAALFADGEAETAPAWEAPSAEETQAAWEEDPAWEAPMEETPVEEASVEETPAAEPAPVEETPAWGGGSTDWDVLAQEEDYDPEA